MTDASLQKIAATYGTPTFVFDTDALQARVRAIQAIWGREIDLCYSIKANPFLLPAMMQVTARLQSRRAFALREPACCGCTCYLFGC